MVGGQQKNQPITEGIADRWSCHPPKKNRQNGVAHMSANSRDHAYIYGKRMNPSKPESTISQEQLCAAVRNVEKYLPKPKAMSMSKPYGTSARTRSRGVFIEGKWRRDSVGWQDYNL